MKRVCEYPWLRTAAAMLGAGLLTAGVRLAALEPRDDPGWYCINTWRQAQGLPQNMVYAVVQTKDGYIWTGTRGGVSRFDGVNFDTFDDLKENQLKELEVWTLLADPDGSLWIGTFGGGVTRFKDGRFTTYTTADGLVNNFVSCLARDADGGIWIGTDQGISRFHEGRFTNYTAKDAPGIERVRTLFVDRDGSVWVGTVKGEINHFVGGRFQRPAMAGPLPSWEIRAFLRDRAGDLWIGSFNGVFRLHEGKTIRFTPGEGLSAVRIYSMFEDGEGNIWAGTEVGLDRYLPGQGVFRNEYKPTPADPVQAICQDHENSLWLGLRTSGLARVRQGLFKSYTRSDGLLDSSVSVVLCDRQNRVWLGTGIGLQRLENGKFTALSEQNGLPSRPVEALLKDRTGRLWVGSVSGLYRTSASIDDPAWMADPQFVPVPNPDIPNMSARGLFEDRSGAIWISTVGEGLARFRDNRFTTYTTKDGLAHNAVRSLGEDREGNLWLGTRDGLNRFRDGTFTTLTTKDGLAGNVTGPMYRDRENALWIGTRYGVSRFKDGRFTNLTVKDGLPTNFVYSFIEDDLGNVWGTYSKGIFRVAKRQLDDCADGRIPAIKATVFGQEHGLSSTAIPVGYAPTSSRAPDGRLWFALFGGVAVIDPAKVVTNTLPPPVHIERVSINRQDYALDGVATVPPGRGDLEFHYTALSFLAPEKVRFKYQLVGYDMGWVDPGSRRAAYYSNIAPGKYTFKVIGANNDGVWNEASASFAFQLQPHFYQTRWFYGLSALGALMAALGLHYYRTRIMRAHERTLVRVVDERTKELRGYKEHLEEQVAERTRALHENRELLQAIIDGSTAIIYMKDLAGHFLLVNRRFAELCGTTKESLLGKTGYDVFPTAVATVFDANDCKALSTADPVELEETLAFADGARTYLSIKCPLRDATGRPYALCGMSTDMTQVKLMEEQLRQSQKMDAIGRLAGGIAHDFNNLLTAINGYASLALQKLTPASPLYNYLSQILMAGEKAGGLTHQLLAYSRKQVMVPRRWDLNGIASHMEALLRRIVGEDIDFFTILHPGRHDVLVDRGQVEQIILNLAVNARDAMPTGGKLVVEVDNVMLDENYTALHPEITPGSYVMLAVTDTGEGMTAEVKARLFEPFFTTKEIGKGTGLGLSVVYGIVKQSSAGIDVTSEVGRGTTFRIYFREASNESTPGGPAEPVVKAEPPRGCETIFLVEDEESVRNFVRDALEANGYKVLTARNGREALEILGRTDTKVDLVLTDVVMPDLGGLELGDRLRQVSPDLPVVFMSGYAENMILRAGSTKTDERFLSKPVSTSQLISTIRDVLRQPMRTHQPVRLLGRAEEP
ncbi:MAG TPA: two-component regulator propeller domain-containing protein [Opitutaceae bacterium]|nr:two-component regulator propeller domain-containing protein [Opitutaceae bacterium]